MATAYFHMSPSIEFAALQSSASQAERTQTNNTNEENQHELSILEYSTIKTVNSVWTCKICFFFVNLSKNMWSRRSGTYSSKQSEWVKNILYKHKNVHSIKIYYVSFNISCIHFSTVI